MTDPWPEEMPARLIPRMSVAQLADAWGCSRQHIYTLLSRGELRAVRIGNLIRFRPEDVADYESRQCHAPKQSAQLIPSLAGEAAIMSSGGNLVPRAGFLAAQKSLRKRGAS